MRRPTTARTRVKLSARCWLRSIAAGAALLALRGAPAAAQDVLAQQPVAGSELAVAGNEAAVAGSELTVVEPSPLGQFLDYMGLGKPSESDALHGASYASELPAANASMLVDPNVQPAANMAQFGYLPSEYEPGPAPVSVAQPAAWISGPYLKAGPTMVVGHELLGDQQDVGYTIAGGYRVPFGPAFDERMFLDFGGSYLSAYGSETRPIDGQTDVLDGDGNVTLSIPTADLFNSTLKEVKRATANAAVGWYWGDPIDVRSGDPQWRIATRFGGRYGHARGRFDEVAAQVLPEDRRFRFDYYNRTDTIGGLFVGTEAILLARDTRIGSTAITIDGELSNDWIEFGAWGRGSLGTASVTLGFMLSR